MKRGKGGQPKNQKSHRIVLHNKDREEKEPGICWGGKQDGGTWLKLGVFIDKGGGKRQQAR